MLCDVLRREQLVNHKKVHRPYKREGLQVRRRRRKRVVAGQRVPLVAARQANERWSMDFTRDTLAEFASLPAALRAPPAPYEPQAVLERRRGLRQRPVVRVCYAIPPGTSTPLPALGEHPGVGRVL